MPTRRAILTWIQAVCLVCVAMSSTGCNAVLLMGWLIGGPPQTDPDFHIRTKHEITDKKNKPVLVVCFAPPELKWDNADVDHNLARHIAAQLREKKIPVIDTDKVHAWTDKNPNWSKPAEIGAEFDAGYVIYVDLRQFSLFEERSAELYRGRADLTVEVIDMDEGKNSSSIYSKSIHSMFPTTIGVSVDDYEYNTWKKMYLSALSGEIGRLFYPEPTGAAMPNSALPPG